LLEPGRGRRAIAGWAFYDWASSAFPTVIVTFVFAAYFTQAVAENPEVGTAQWGAAMSLSVLLVAVLSPLLGAIADRGGPRKPWILVCTLVSAAASAGLWVVAPGAAHLMTALVLVAVANAAFEFGQVFYNAMLPEVAGPERVGRVSGWAWSLGYAGGLACLALTLVAFVQPEPALFGLDREAAEHVRITGPLVAVWFLVFAVPLFVLTPDRPSSGLGPRAAVAAGLRQLIETLRQLSRYRNITRFLIARMLYTDGLNTLLASGLGALGFAWVDDWIGAKPTVIIAVSTLTLFSGAILLIEDKILFYVLGCLIGSMLGPAQAASRSLMARLAPAELRTEMFGLYALSGKATAFIGPALVGWVTLWAHSQRVGMATILLFFVAGLALLIPVRERPD
jgi:UMF1 family MFS transporter